MEDSFSSNIFRRIRKYDFVSSSNFPKTIFFFGAGASKPANVGTTIELVEGFRKSLEAQDETELKHLLDEIIRHANYDSIDIEQLMTILERLVNREQDELLKFYDSSTLKIQNSTNVKNLQQSLKKFIQQTASVQKDKVDFLKPLLSFPIPVTIFSVNYDTAIEQFCNVYKIRYTDGFEYEWNSKLFDDRDDPYDFHLKKIHGSIMWYQTDNGNYVKLPLPPTDSLPLIFGEKATPLILYPMQKWEFVEPLLELLLHFKTQLTKTDFVIIVGYSFRDSHIVRLLHESARKNRNLIILLVGPHARKLYDEYLQFYHSDVSREKIPSLLKNRVLCLQYGFEQIIGALKEIVTDCNVCLKNERIAHKDRIEGHEVRPEDLIYNFAKIEFLDKADEWKNEIKWARATTLKNINAKLCTSSLRLFVIAEIQEKTDSANYWLKHFLESFDLLNTLRLSSISIVSNVIHFPNFQNMTGDGSAQQVFEELQMFLDSQSNLRGNKFSPLLRDVVDKVTKWFYHAYENMHSVTFQDYFQNMKHFFMANSESIMPIELHELIDMLDDKFLVKDYDNKKDEVTEKIKEIELKVLKTIFNEFQNLSRSIESVHTLRYNDICQIK